MASTKHLPDEILLTIFRCLDPVTDRSTLDSVLLTCRRFYDVGAPWVYSIFQNVEKYGHATAVRSPFTWLEKIVQNPRRAKWVREMLLFSVNSGITWATSDDPNERPAEEWVRECQRLLDGVIGVPTSLKEFLIGSTRNCYTVRISLAFLLIVCTGLEVLVVQSQYWDIESLFWRLLEDMRVWDIDLAMGNKPLQKLRYLHYRDARLQPTLTNLKLPNLRRLSITDLIEPLGGAESTPPTPGEIYSTSPLYLKLGSCKLTAKALTGLLSRCSNIQTLIIRLAPWEMEGSAIDYALSKYENKKSIRQLVLDISPMTKAQEHDARPAKSYFDSFAAMINLRILAIPSHFFNQDELPNPCLEESVSDLLPPSLQILYILGAWKRFEISLDSYGSMDTTNKIDVETEFASLGQCKQWSRELAAKHKLPNLKKVVHTPRYQYEREISCTIPGHTEVACAGFDDEQDLYTD
jgi:hypothetical protein